MAYYTITYPFQITNPYSSSIRSFYRKDACMNANPDTGFLRLDWGEIASFEKDGIYVGPWHVWAGGGQHQYTGLIINNVYKSNNGVLWPAFSPLPPGFRYEDQSDIYRTGQIVGYGISDPAEQLKWDPFAQVVVEDRTYPDLIWPTYAHVDGEGVKRHNLIRNMGRDGPRNYQWYKQIVNFGAGSYEGLYADFTRGAETFDNEEMWTGTCKDPLNWNDPFWAAYIDYAKLALYLEEHPAMLLGGGK